MKGIATAKKNIPAFKPKAGTSDVEQSLFPGLNLWLEGDLAYYEHGLFRLREQVTSTGSVKQACAGLKISYSRGWSLIDEAEAHLNCKLVHRVQGGANGGRATVTERGQTLLERYNAVCDNLKKSADEILETYFGKNENNG
ncbi:MAG: LysR family transcriptional regulator [Oscillospiraceae bacterium]|nr:LysR family transcriptional regulator [Oscillospiraceae bacterium]